MKKVKLMVAFFLIAFSFLFSGELYQNYLMGFSNSFYEFGITYASDINDELLEMMTELCAAQNLPVFTYDKTTEMYAESSLTIFATEDAAAYLKDEKFVTDGVYHSFFSGDTMVSVRPFSEYEPHSAQTRFYFIGESRAVNAVHKQFRETALPVTSYQRSSRSSMADVTVLIVWIVACVLLLLLTWFDIQFQKKRNFIRISLGASKWSLLLHNILLDTCVLLLELLGSYFVLRRFIALHYHLAEIVLVLVIFLVCNALLYFSLLHYNYKEVLYGANVNETLLANCYLLKAITLMFTIATVSVNTVTL